MLTLVRNLTAEGLIDGVGLQCHINTGWEKAFGGQNPSGLAKTFAQYHELGLVVHITELDVKNGPAQGGRNDTAQADTYRALLQACLDAPVGTCRNFETWGFEDGHTWIQEAQHPLPFDEYFRIKAAGTAIAELLASAPRPGH